MGAVFGVIDEARTRQQRRRRVLFAIGSFCLGCALVIVIATSGGTPRPARGTPIASRPAVSQPGGQHGQVICLVDSAAQARTKEQRAVIKSEIDDLKKVRNCGAAAELRVLTQMFRMSKAVPDVVGERLDRAETKLQADGLDHYGVGYGGPDLKPGSARDWIVCGTSPARGALLTPPRLGLWLIARGACAHGR